MNEQKHMLHSNTVGEIGPGEQYCQTDCYICSNLNYQISFLVLINANIPHLTTFRR